MKRFSREHDEMILSWVKRRASGVSCGRIAIEDDTPKTSVVSSTTAIKAHDLAEAKDPNAAAAYWGAA